MAVTYLTFLTAELTDILQDAETVDAPIQVFADTWRDLEGKHVCLWQQEKERYLDEVKNTANYKLESISSNYRNRKRNLEQKLRDIFDEKIIRMYQSELNSATETYNARVAEINERTDRADVHTSLVANGIIDIKRA